MSLRIVLGILLSLPVVMPAASIRYAFDGYVFVAPDFLPNLASNQSNFSFTINQASMSSCGQCGPIVNRYYFRYLLVTEDTATATYDDIQGTDAPMLTFYATYPTSFLSQVGTLPSQGYGISQVSFTDAQTTFMPEPGTYGMVGLALVAILYGIKRRAAVQRTEL